MRVITIDDEKDSIFVPQECTKAMAKKIFDDKTKRFERNVINLEDGNIEATCPFCGRRFISRDKRTYHCSPECVKEVSRYRTYIELRRKNNSEVARAHVQRIADNDKLYDRVNLGNGHYEFTCAVCGKRTISRSRNSITCSEKCKEERKKLSVELNNSKRSANSTVKGQTLVGEVAYINGVPKILQEDGLWRFACANCGKITTSTDTKRITCSKSCQEERTRLAKEEKQRLKKLQPKKPRAKKKQKEVVDIEEDITLLKTSKPRVKTDWYDIVQVINKTGMQYGELVAKGIIEG